MLPPFLINWRHLKITMGLTGLKCKTVRRVAKELTVFAVVYNLALVLMLESQAIHGHWGVENGLHWTLDVSMNEDQCRLRVKHGGRELLAAAPHCDQQAPTLGDQNGQRQSDETEPAAQAKSPVAGVTSSYLNRSWRKCEGPGRTIASDKKWVTNDAQQVTIDGYG